MSPPLPWNPKHLPSSRDKAGGDLSEKPLHGLLAVVPPLSPFLGWQKFRVCKKMKEVGGRQGLFCEGLIQLKGLCFF